MHLVTRELIGDQFLGLQTVGALCVIRDVGQILSADKPAAPSSIEPYENDPVDLAALPCCQ